MATARKKPVNKKVTAKIKPKADKKAVAKVPKGDANLKRDASITKTLLEKTAVTYTQLGEVRGISDQRIRQVFLKVTGAILVKKHKAFSAKSGKVTDRQKLIAIKAKIIPHLGAYAEGKIK